MAYNYFPTGYQPMQYVPQQQMMQQPQQVQQPVSDKKWIQGEAGAKSYLLAPGSTVTLWDSEAQVFYEKTADFNGVPHMRKAVYRYEDETSQNNQNQAVANFATKDDVESIMKEIVALRAILQPSEDKPKGETKK